MTTSQLITLDFDDEVTSTRKLLERVPLDDAHRGYQPHPKSMRLDRLASHVAEIPGWFKLVVEVDVLELDPAEKPHITATTADLLAFFDRSVEAGRAAITAAADDVMQKDWTLRLPDRVLFSSPRVKVIRSLINHMVHHRAQLGVYLRLNGVAIPGMYGPSADEAWSAAAA